MNLEGFLMNSYNVVKHQMRIATTATKSGHLPAISKKCWGTVSSRTLQSSKRERMILSLELTGFKRVEL